MHEYLVLYRIGHSVRGDATDFSTLVNAYTAEDAAYQAMIDPKRRAAVNPGSYAYLLAVSPFKDGMRVDVDGRQFYQFCRE